MRVYIAIYTWVAVVVEDSVDRDPEEWQHFVPRFYSGQEQSGEIARGWDYCLRLCYEHFHPKPASFIIAASLNFTNMTILTGCEMPRMARTASAKGSLWAHYVRQKDGIGEVYAWFTFPKERYPDISLFMEVIPDIEDVIDKVNDILS